MRRIPLLDPSWEYFRAVALEDFTAAEWPAHDRQQQAYFHARQAETVLALMRLGAAEPSFGFAINIYDHALQSATMALRDGLDDETVAVIALHDIGFVACPPAHGEFAAALMRPYIADRHYWMLRHHQLFQDHHVHDHPEIDPRARERWRGHPHFAWTAEFCAKYDQAAMDGAYDTAPLETFEPMIRRLFARPPQSVPPLD